MLIIDIIVDGDGLLDCIIWKGIPNILSSLKYAGEWISSKYSYCCLPTGEAMEQGLRDCCRSIRIGKILIQSDEETQKAKVYYAKFPPDVYRRKVLLMYPILSE